ncbi:MAG: GNAT family N-acetyltransferase [Actinomycetota bacterium]|nr:GNAT family N-acetyltransferase [Actinomycetota bacterium]
MEPNVRVRVAERRDAEAVAGIGTAAMTAQYVGLVDPAAVRAAVAQTYSVAAVGDCIDRCGSAELAEFLVAERDGDIEGFLHFDSFGPEPELHRLYVDAKARSGGLGGLLIQALHDRLPESLRYMLLVLEGNDRAIAFYRRHGLEIGDRVEGLAYYQERMGVTFPPSTRPFHLVLMRRT